MEKKVKNILVELKGNHPAFLIIEYTDGTKGTLDIKRGQKIADVLRENVRKGTITLEGYNPKKEIKVVQAPVFNADSLKDSLVKEKKLEEANKEIATLKNKYGEVITINTRAFSEKKTKKILIWSGIGVVATGLALAAILAFKSKKNNNLPTATPTATMSATATPEIIPTPEIAVTPSATPVLENYDVNKFDTINDPNKVNARAEWIYNDLKEKLSGTDEESKLDTYNVEWITKLLNFYNSGPIPGFEPMSSYDPGDTPIYLGALDGLANIEDELNIVFPLYMWQLDGSVSQVLAKQIYDARVKITDGQTTKNKNLAEEGVRATSYIIYKTFAMPGLDGAIDVAQLETPGAKVFNVNYLMTSDRIISEGYDQTTFIDDCGEEQTYRALYNAFNNGGSLPNHSGVIGAPFTAANGQCVSINLLSSYSIDAANAVVAENDKLTKPRIRD